MHTSRRVPLVGARTRPSGESPSAWAHRLPAAFLAGAGFAIALWIAFFQTGVLPHLWDPFFGSSAERIVTSSLSRLLPIPDAALGAAAYLAELCLVLLGNEDRYRERTWVVLAYGGLALLMALGSVGLILAQAFYFQAWCTLCLGSAGVSLILVWPALSEAKSAWKAHHR